MRRRIPEQIGAAWIRPWLQRSLRWRLLRWRCGRFDSGEVARPAQRTTSFRRAVSIPDGHEGRCYQHEQKYTSVHRIDFPEGAEVRVLESLIVVAGDQRSAKFANETICRVVTATQAQLCHQSRSYRMEYFASRNAAVASQAEATDTVQANPAIVDMARLHVYPTPGEELEWVAVAALRS